MAPGASEERDPLVTAYEERTAQIYDTRAALGEAVSALRTELEQRRGEVAGLSRDNDSLRADNRALRADAERLHAEAGSLHERIAALNAELRSIRRNPIVRLATLPRRIMRRLRKQRQSR
jgi:chromosome segregation ATPase